MLPVTCYTDASFQTDRDDYQSQLGYVFTLNGGAIVWKSSKQKTVAMSTAESKIYCCIWGSKRSSLDSKIHFRLRSCSKHRKSHWDALWQLRCNPNRPWPWDSKGKQTQPKAIPLYPWTYCKGWYKISVHQTTAHGKALCTCTQYWITFRWDIIWWIMFGNHNWNNVNEICSMLIFERN